MTLTTLALLGLFGCKKGSSDDTGVFIDRDGDGYDAAVDCDDDDPDINPGVDELCDGLDNDCNDLIDDDPVDGDTYWSDNDQDGFGGGDGSRMCAQPPDTAAQGGDCDDEDPDINPDADEVCDDVDNDCNGVLDDNPTDGTTYYMDADEDGYGDPDAPVLACEQGDYADNDLDCEDAEASVNPDGTEVCNDGFDNDCDGTDNGCGALGDVSLADADITWLGSNAGDKLGGPARAVGDLDADSYPDIALSARGYNEGAGAVYLVDGPYATGEQDVETVSGGWIVGEAADDQLYGVTGIGDWNSDGSSDFAVSARNNDNFATDAGAIYLFFGVPGQDVSAGSAQVIVTGAASGDKMGVLSGPADIDGDGVPDLIASSYDANSKAGAVYVLSGGLSEDGDVGTVASLTVSGSEGTDYRFGGGLSVIEDLDGDGVGDFIVGAPYDDDGGDKAGAVSVFYGSSGLSGALADTDADAKLTGSNTNDQVGWGIGPAGDQNNDGHEDLLISATRSNLGGQASGAVYLVAGPITGGDLDSVNLAVIYGEEADDKMAPSFGGDINGDGQLDVMVSARSHDPGGAAYLFLGPVSGSWSASSADAKWSGLADGDGAGSPINIPGDLDGDGKNDLLIGARDADTTVGTDAGAAYLIFGQGL